MTLEELRKQQQQKKLDVVLGRKPEACCAKHNKPQLVLCAFAGQFGKPLAYCCCKCPDRKRIAKMTAPTKTTKHEQLELE